MKCRASYIIVGTICQGKVDKPHFINTYACARWRLWYLLASIVTDEGRKRTIMCVSDVTTQPFGWDRFFIRERHFAPALKRADSESEAKYKGII